MSRARGGPLGSSLTRNRREGLCRTIMMCRTRGAVRRSRRTCRPGVRPPRGTLSRRVGCRRPGRRTVIPLVRRRGTDRHPVTARRLGVRRPVMARPRGVRRPERNLLVVSARPVRNRRRRTALRLEVLVRRPGLRDRLPCPRRTSHPRTAVQGSAGRSPRVWPRWCHRRHPNLRCPPGKRQLRA